MQKALRDGWLMWALLFFVVVIVVFVVSQNKKGQHDKARVDK